MKRGNIAAELLPAAAALMTNCRRRTATNVCAAAKLLPLLPLLTFYLSLLSSFPSPWLLPLLVDC